MVGDCGWKTDCLNPDGSGVVIKVNDRLNHTWAND